MAAQNFRIKNGLNVGSTEVIDSSGDLTAAAFGTAAKEAIDDQVNTLMTAGSNITLTYDDAAGTLTVAGQAGDITGVTAGDGLSGGGTSGGVTLALDHNELTAASVDVANDSISIIDASDSNATRKESIADLATAMAGTNITATNGVLSTTADITGVTAGDGLSGGGSSGALTLALDHNELTGASVDVANDSITIIDASDSNATRKESIADLATAMAGTNITATNGVLSTTADITGVTAGDGLSGGGTSGALTVALDLNELTAAAVAVDGDSIAIIDASDSNASRKESIADFVAGIAGTGLSASSGQLSLTDTGYVTGVTAGDGLSGGGTDGTVTVALDLNELTAATVAVANDSIAIIDASDNGSKKEAIADVITAIAGDALTATSGVLAVGVDDSSIEIDSDAIQVKASGITNAMLAGSIANDKLAGSIANAKLANSAITINSNSVSLGGSVTLDSDDIGEGSSNQWHTTERVQDVVGAQLATNGSHTNITASYDDAGDGAVDLSITDAVIRGKVSVTDSGGDGSLAYNNSTGVITYTGPSASEVRAHITAGTGVAISSGEVSIGQAVSTSSNVEFGNLTLSGNLTVNGSTVTNSATNTTIEDALIELGSGNSGSNSNDLGLILERGSTGNNGFMGWDESADSFILGTTTDTGASTGDLTIAVAPLSVGAVTITNASNSGGTARNIYQSTSAPGGGDGAVGDLWILYS
tara:strand:+ start:25751 stop:27877 length:2127 start_codon:yes stop_codon:yes gene_type:complete